MSLSSFSNVSPPNTGEASKSADFALEITEFDLCFFDFMLDKAIFKLVSRVTTCLESDANGLPWTVTAHVLPMSWTCVLRCCVVTIIKKKWYYYYILL